MNNECKEVIKKKFDDFSKKVEGYNIRKVDLNLDFIKRELENDIAEIAGALEMALMCNLISEDEFSWYMDNYYAIPIDVFGLRIGK